MRIWVLLKHFNIPFEAHLKPMEQGLRQKSFKTFSPSSKVPCLHQVDDDSGSSDGSGTLVVWDSLAIAENLAESHPDLPIWPPRAAGSSPAAAQRAFARCAAAEMHAGFEAVRSDMSMSCGARIDIGPFLAADTADSAALRADLARLDALWAEGLRRFGGPWLAGATFGAVDAFYAPVAVRLRTYPAAAELLGEEARGYAARLMEHPAVVEWVEDGTKEVWREGTHEQDCLKGGKRLLADYRKTAGS
jgi:glutathione S-transferase